MKRKSDPRHLRRISLMRELFTWNFQTKKRPPKDIAEIVSNLLEIDAVIATGAPDRPIEEINKIDLAILRLATFELIIAPRFHRDHVISQHSGIEERCDCDIIKKDTPVKVVIDEAIELGKEFGSDSSSSFINGALGQVIKLKGV